MNKQPINLKSMKEKIKRIKDEPIVSIEQINGLEYDMNEVENKDGLDANSNVGSYFIEIIKDEILHEFKGEPMDYTLENIFEVGNGEPEESPVQYSFIDIENEHLNSNGYKLKNKFDELFYPEEAIMFATSEVECPQPMGLTPEAPTILNVLPQPPPNHPLVDKHPNKIPMVKLAPSKPIMASKALKPNINDVKAPEKNLLLPSQCLDTVSSKIIEVEPSKFTALEISKPLVVVPSKHSNVEPSTSPPAVEPLLLSEVERSQLPTAKIRLLKKKNNKRNPFSKKILQLHCCHRIVSKIIKLMNKKLSKINKTDKALKYNILKMKKFLKNYRHCSRLIKKLIIELNNYQDIKQWKGFQTEPHNIMKKLCKLFVPQKLTCKKILDQSSNFKQNLEGDDFENHSTLPLSLIKSYEISLVDHQELQSLLQPESEYRSIMEPSNVSESEFSLILSKDKPKDLKIKPTQFMQNISDVPPFYDINCNLYQHSEIKALKQQHDLQHQRTLQNSNWFLLKISGMKKRNTLVKKLFQGLSRQRWSEPVLPILLAENPLKIGPEFLKCFPKNVCTSVFSYLQMEVFLRMHTNIQTLFLTTSQFVKLYRIMQKVHHTFKTLKKLNILQQHYNYYTLGIKSTMSQVVPKQSQFLEIKELEQSQFSKIKPSKTQPLLSLCFPNILENKNLKDTPDFQKLSIVRLLNESVPLLYSPYFSAEQRSMRKMKRKRTPSFTKTKPVSRKKHKPVSYIKIVVPKQRNYLHKRCPLKDSIFVHTKSLKVKQEQKLLEKSSKDHSLKSLKQLNLTKPSIQHNKIVSKTVRFSEDENCRLQYPQHQLSMVSHNNHVSKLLQPKVTRRRHKRPKLSNFSNTDSSTGDLVLPLRFPENEPFIAVESPPSSTVQSFKPPVLEKKAEKQVTSNQQSKIRILESQDSQQYINVPSSKCHENTFSNEYAAFEAIDLSLLKEKHLQQQRPPLTNTSSYEEIVRYSDWLRVNVTRIPSSILKKKDILGNKKQRKLVDDCSDKVFYLKKLCDKLDVHQDSVEQCAKTTKTRSSEVRKRKSVCSVCKPKTMSTIVSTRSVTSVITTPTLASATKSQANNIKSTPILHKSANNYYGSLYKSYTNITHKSANICTSVSAPSNLFSTEKKITSISTAVNRKSVESRDILPRKLKGCRKFGKCCPYC